ncbi:MAG: hypothetical protein HS104_09930 [Polyangiaceae bacterium]|nr:hypothetical protein [Polyangiaceae bacterium]MBK8994651.1 hypothetical protein [Myxococcales bacterium]MCE7895133.1 hypothetical protein [Sorangiineae bacterium PRO1]MCL4750859.1 hypothetical protein [Myxococcales bacterium]
MKRRLRWPVLGTLGLALLELALGRALATHEPLAAVLTGKLWVAFLALSALSVRLLLFFGAPAWLAAACLELWLGSRAGRR